MESIGNITLILTQNVKNKSHIYYDYKIGDKVLEQKVGILHKTESHYNSDPWTSKTAHMNEANLKD